MAIALLNGGNRTTAQDLSSFLIDALLMPMVGRELINRELLPSPDLHYIGLRRGEPKAVSISLDKEPPL